GLAHLFWVPANQSVAPRNSRYAAPELFERQVSRTCDQYSLALIYQELLTGAHPFRGRALQPASGGRAPAGPDLQPLPARDREAIARALNPDPLERWPSCTDLVRALQGERPGAAPRDERADPFVESVRNQETALATSGPGVS